MNLGQEIRKRRLTLGWSQQKLASKAGVHLNSISAYEKGKREPCLSSAILILNAMGYSLAIVHMAGEASVRPQGEWVFPYTNKRYRKCSVCGETYYAPHSNKFCGECGARMKGAGE